ncbi:hypothetical protein VNI00_007780 [Paramarasmius palmivorus]|uniref:Uncharacterized protein n=1 Tax=Paramarasmius palmivorus TaxID=297713 RepID=A0AAW0CVB3_9AGAR
MEKKRLEQLLKRQMLQNNANQEAIRDGDHAQPRPYKHLPSPQPSDASEDPLMLGGPAAGDNIDEVPASNEPPAVQLAASITFLKVAIQGQKLDDAQRILQKMIVDLQSSLDVSPDGTGLTPVGKVQFATLQSFWRAKALLSTEERQLLERDICCALDCAVKMIEDSIGRPGFEKWT